MGLGRKLLAGMDALGARVTAGELDKLTPAERQRYEAWHAGPAGDPRLVGKVLEGPAGEALAGIAPWPETAHIEDPRRWEAQRAAELAQRDAARAPYLAGPRRVRIARVAAPVGEALRATGLAARPELVYGVYRVPDFMGGYVEWDVVHAAPGTLPAARPPAQVRLDAGERWVPRAPGEPRPLDEDVALAFLADIGPQRTLGIARDVDIAQRPGVDEHTLRLEAAVRGVHVLAPALPERKPPLRADPPEDVLVDVLGWEPLAQAVHPVRQQRPPLPSPFPYLPLTPQELLTAYLEIVGVDPADSYSAQVTHDQPVDLLGRSSASAHVRRTGGGPKLRCADGTPRERMAGGSILVLAYRDRPEYAAGRERFEAYAVTELHAHLRRGLDLRAPVPKPPGRLERTLDKVGAAVELLTMEPSEDGRVPPRYC